MRDLRPSEVKKSYPWLPELVSGRANTSNQAGLVPKPIPSTHCLRVPKRNTVPPSSMRGYIKVIYTLERKALTFPSPIFTQSVWNDSGGNTHRSLKFRGRKIETKWLCKISCPCGGWGGAFLVKILGALIQSNYRNNSNATCLNSCTINHQLSSSIKVRANGKISNHSIRMRILLLKVIILNIFKSQNKNCPFANPNSENW